MPIQLLEETYKQPNQRNVNIILQSNRMFCSLECSQCSCANCTDPSKHAICRDRDLYKTKYTIAS